MASVPWTPWRLPATERLRLGGLRRWCGGAAALGLLSLAGFRPAEAFDSGEVEFNPDFLRTPVDLRLYARGNPVPPGLHRVEIHVNGEWRARRDLAFVLPRQGSLVAQPCFDAALLDTLGLAPEAPPQAPKPLPAETAAEPLHPGCRFIEQLAPGAVASYDLSRQQLDIQAPQAMTRKRPRQPGPESWDDGVDAGTLAYDYAGFAADQGEAGRYASHYLGLRSGLNWAGWRLRQAGSLTAGTGGLQYRLLSAHAETALPAWRSRLVLGDAQTEGLVFDGLGLRGVQLGSDTRMLPNGGGALQPVVRGLARGPAMVVVRQQKVVVHQVAVPPGPFVLEDLPVSTQAGDLQVTVTEADGSQQEFTVPNAAMPEALERGLGLYSLALGANRNPGAAAPMLALATGRYGWSERATVFGGLLVSRGYQSASLGAAFNTALGPLSAALSHARAEQPDGTVQQGGRLALRQARHFADAATSLSLAGEWDLARGYRAPSQALSAAGEGQPPAPPADGAADARPRGHLWLNASQALAPGWGSLSLAVNARRLWNGASGAPEFLLAYGQQAGTVSYGFNLARTRVPFGGPRPVQWSLTLSLPLEAWPWQPRLATTAAGGGAASVVHSSLSGSLLPDQSLGYSAYLASQNGLPGSGDRARVQAAGVLAHWTAPLATLGASLSVGAGGTRQYSASVSGGVVLFAGGVVLARELGDTLALVSAKDAAGAGVAGWAGLRLDAEGRGVVPHLQPYRSNPVGIDPRGLPPSVALKATSRQVVPSAGAVVLLRFETESGQSLLVSGTLADGRPLPFGALVRDAAGRSVGHVAQGGQALLRLAEPEGRLQVEWGEASHQRCGFDYTVPRLAGSPAAPVAPAERLPRLEVSCA